MTTSKKVKQKLTQYLKMTSSKKVKQLVIIEGNIGSGKTTLINNCKHDESLKQCGFIDEPVPYFSKFVAYNNKEYNPLQEQYQNGMNFPISQQHIIQSLVKKFEEPEDHNVIICERSLLSPIYFVNNWYNLGNLTSFMRDYLLTEIYKVNCSVLAENDLRYAGVFFLNAPADICFKRIEERDRKGENFISKEYISKLQVEIFSSIAMWQNKFPSLLVNTCSETNEKKVLPAFKSFIKGLGLLKDDN